MKRIVLAALLWAVSVTGLSGAPAYSFRRYTVRDGLSSNAVRALLQDRKGLIWLGTSEGLDSFDGREVIHHAFPEGGSAGILSLLEDSARTLWVGTDGGLFRFAGDSLAQVPSLTGVEVTALAEDRDGFLWVATWGDGVFHIRDGQVDNWLEGHRVEDILVGADGRLWIADTSVGEGLQVYHAATRTFVSPGLTFQGCTPARICALDEDGNGDLWLGTWNSGLYRLDLSERTVHPAVPPGSGLNHVHSLTHDGAWNFLVGSDDGLLEVNPLTGERTLYRNDRKDPASLSDKFVYPVLRDHEGGLWIGTYYGGVNYVAPNIGQFDTRSLSDLTDADEEFVVSCLCEDPDGPRDWL